MASYTSVQGGGENLAEGSHASIGAGQAGKTLAMYASVNGGQDATAEFPYSSVLGGESLAALTPFGMMPPLINPLLAETSSVRHPPASHRGEEAIGAHPRTARSSADFSLLAGRVLGRASAPEKEDLESALGGAGNEAHRGGESSRDLNSKHGDALAHGDYSSILGGLENEAHSRSSGASREVKGTAHDTMTDVLGGLRNEAHGED